MWHEAESVVEAVEHESGHVVAIVAEPSVAFDRLQWYGDRGMWSLYSSYRHQLKWAGLDRDREIGREARLALAGGASMTPLSQHADSAAAVRSAVGTVDFEFAHDWASKRGRQPSEARIERALLDEWTRIRSLLRTDIAQVVLRRVRRNIDEALDGVTSNRGVLSASRVLAGIELKHVAALQQAARETVGGDRVGSP